MKNKMKKKKNDWEEWNLLSWILRGTSFVFMAIVAIHPKVDLTQTILITILCFMLWGIAELVDIKEALIK